jgi:tetratricopeptide (TPR) repeat protein
LLTAVAVLFIVGLALVTWQWQRAVDREKAADSARRAQEITAIENARLAAEEHAASLKAKEEEGRARAALDRAKQEEKKALAEADRTKRSLEFLTSLFRVSDPLDFGGYALRSSQERGRALTAQQLLDRGSEQLVNELKDKPLVRATLLCTIGDVYRNMGLYDKAAKNLEESVRIRRKELGEKHPDYALSLFHLGWLHLDRGDYDQAEALYRKALKIQEAALPPDDPATINTRFHIGWVLGMCGEPAAEPLLRSVVAHRQKLLGPMDRETMIAKVGLAAFFIDQDRALEAFPYIVEILRFAEAQGGKNNFEAIQLFQQGMVAASLGFDAKAQKSLEGSLAVARKQLGDDHMYMALVLHELAKVLHKQGKIDEAEERLQECLKVIRNTVGMEHPRSAIAIDSMAGLLVEKKRPAEAIALYEEALKANERRFGKQNRWRFGLVMDRAALEAKHGSPENAERLAREGLALLSQGTSKQEERAASLNGVAVALARAGKRKAAEDLYKAAIELRRGLTNSRLAPFAVLLANYGDLLMDERRFSEAAVQLREAVVKGKGTDALKERSGIKIYGQLGRVESRLGNFVEAEKAFREALAQARRTPKYSGDALCDRLYDLAGALVEQGKMKEAVALLKETAPIDVNGKPTYFEGGLRYRATIHALQGETDECRETVATLLKHFNADSRRSLRLRVMRTLLLLDQPGEGDTEFKACLAVSFLTEIPKDRDARITLALALLRLGNPAESERVLNELPAEVATHFPMVGFLRAWAAFERGDKKQAERTYRDACRVLDEARVPERAMTDAIPEWHHCLEAELLRKYLERLLERAQ